MYRKTYEVVGYTQDGAAYCKDCWGDRPEPEEGDGGPVLLQDADDLLCDECFYRLDGEDCSPNCTVRAHEHESEEEPECEGHPAGPNDPIGVTVYCDGSCRQED